MHNDEVVVQGEVNGVGHIDQAKAWPSWGTYESTVDIQTLADRPCCHIAHRQTNVSSAVVLQRISALTIKVGLPTLFVDS